MSYTELQITTNFSFLRGGSHPEEIVEHALALGYKEIAITDRNTLAGIVRAFIAAKGKDIRIIPACRLDLLDGVSLLAYPTDKEAYARLSALLSEGNIRTEKGQCHLYKADVFRYAKGIKFVVIPPSSVNLNFELDPEFLKDLRQYKNAFGSDLYIGAIRSYQAHDSKILYRLWEVSKELNVPMVAMNDVHYHNRERRELQDILTCVREKCTIYNAGFRLYQNAERYLKAINEMQRLFRQYPEAIERTQEIVAACQFSLSELQYVYPEEITSEGRTPQEEIVHLVWQGAKEKFDNEIPGNIKDTIQYELDFIERKNYAAYFLTVYDFVRFARSKSILCQGRGSAANSVVCFCLGITSVNPSKFKLLFARFMSDARNEPPDIDVDFEHERREEVIQYIYEKYGRDRAAIVATVTQLHYKGAVRDVAKAMGMSVDTINSLSNASWEFTDEWHNGNHVSGDGFDATDPHLMKVLQLTKQYIGFPRQLGQHTGGFVITRGKLSDLCPILNARMENRTCIEWNKDDIEALGFLPSRMDYFKKLQELVKIEREVDKQAYLELTRSSTVAQRRANGLTWYPIAIRGTELNKAEYITVEVERTTNTDIVHQLRFGVSAMLFSNLDAKNNFLEGTITYAGGNRLKISLRTDELPDWASDGKLGIDLLFDDNSYDEMQAALKLAITLSEKKEEGRLINILTGAAAPTFDATIPVYANPKLNSTQQAAVTKIVQGNELAVVHGPPGTGKTTTLVQAIKALIKAGEKQILVTAPSNTAVDLLSEKLSEEGLNVLRVGNPARVSERLMALTLDSKIAAHSSVKEIKRLKKQAGDFKDMAHKYKRSFGKAEREQRKALFNEAYKIMKDVDKMEQYIIDDVTAKAQVIAATLVGANQYTVRGLRYNTVVIDEAGQALEPACWIPILKGKKLILAGDHFQLSPTVKSDAAARGGLSTTLLEKVIRLHPEAVQMLGEQYRMNETIMGHSSKVFYEDKLLAHHSVAKHLLFPEDLPLTFIDTAGCGFEEKVENNAISNPEEAELLFKHLKRLVAELAAHYTPAQFPTIAVISPYKEQLYVLKEQMAHIPELQPYAQKISVNTIDSFQGQERDIVYISMTRSNNNGIIGFLSDTRRMNVAMTRARKKLVVVGDSATLSQHPFYAGFVAYAESHNAYKSAWDENWDA